MLRGYSVDVSQLYVFRPVGLQDLLGLAYAELPPLLLLVQGHPGYIADGLSLRRNPLRNLGEVNLLENGLIVERCFRHLQNNLW